MPSRRDRARRPGRTLTIESLEPRQMLTAGLKASINASGLLKVVGTDNDERLFISQTNNQISIKGVTGSWHTSKVSSIRIELKGGDDYVSLDSLTNGGNQAITTSFNIYSGNGQERVRLGNRGDAYFNGDGHRLSVTTAGVRLNGELFDFSQPNPKPAGAGISASLNKSGQLRVIGSNGADDILFYQTGGRIAVKGLSGSWAVSQISSIRVDLHNGNDFVSLDSLGNGGSQAIAESFNIYSGNGQQSVQLADGRVIDFNGPGNRLTVTPLSIRMNGQILDLPEPTPEPEPEPPPPQPEPEPQPEPPPVPEPEPDPQPDPEPQPEPPPPDPEPEPEPPPPPPPDPEPEPEPEPEPPPPEPEPEPEPPPPEPEPEPEPPPPDPEPEPEPPPPPPPEPEPEPVPSSWFAENLVDEALIGLAETLFHDDVLSRNDMLSIFELVGAGGVTAAELGDLTTLVGADWLFGDLDHVWKLTSYIVTGNTANAKYKGQNLGNLIVGASEAHLGNLVNKWFLGLDRPAAGSSYSLVSGTLFINGPSYADVRQGSLNDCAFLASLATAAIHSPEIITNMFIANGDGTYTVKFYRSGIAEYVTVDAYLPSGGTKYARVIGGELWVALAEKAYAQVKEMSWFGGGGNTYSSVEWQYAFVTLGHITGQGTIAISSTASASSQSNFATAYNNDKLICLVSKTSGTTSGVVANHAYAVMAYDAGSQTVTLFNPWGISSSNGGILTLTWSQVQANFSYFDRTA